jgi:predicted MFS family arabinose efflux permease
MWFAARRAVELAEPSAAALGSSSSTWNGLMQGTLLGLPRATVIGEAHGWRAAFWVISALTVWPPSAPSDGCPPSRIAGDPLRQETVLSTGLLVIGATFSASSLLNPILTELAGFDVARLDQVSQSPRRARISAVLNSPSTVMSVPS